MDELFFGEYIMDKFGNYTNQIDKAHLKYQVEYILSGKESDYDNLENVANKLVALREVINLLYLITDSEKTGQADAIALGLSTLLTQPELQPLFKYTILVAWSYAESIEDVNYLLRGGKIPLIKTKNNWYLGLEEILTSYWSTRDIQKGENGWDYGTYLRLFLMTTDENKKVFRCMDVVEMDIRNTAGNENFRMDGCFDSVGIQMEVTDKTGNTYSIQRESGYQ